MRDAAETSSACTWSSAARRRSSSSTTPTSRPPPRARSSAPSSTAARTAPRPPASTSTVAPATSFSSGCWLKVDRARRRRPAGRRHRPRPAHLHRRSATACTASSSGPVAGRRHGPRAAASRSTARARSTRPTVDHRCARSIVGDRPAGGLRPGADRAGFAQRRRGARVGQRHALRAGRLGLDARRLPRPARGPRARGRYGLDQRAPRHRLGDAAWRGEGIRVRQGHEHVCAGGVHRGQARRVRADGRAAQGLVRRGVVAAERSRRVPDERD